MNGEVLLQGIVGSRAYGFAHENSDTDRLGVYAARTDSFFGLGQPQESYVTTNPDFTLHEAKKWCRLVLKCNPTAMELVWLPDDLYETRSPLGDELIGIRRHFLSAACVRNSYLGYAHQQFEKLKRAAPKLDDHEDPETVRARRLKHARHLVRLVYQGIDLHVTGTLLIRLDNAVYVRELAEEIVRDSTSGDMLLHGAHAIFDKPGVLPSEPNTVEIEAWLHRVRRAFLEETEK